MDDKNLNTADIPKEGAIKYYVVCDVCSAEKDEPVRIEGEYGEDCPLEDRSQRIFDLVYDHIETHGDPDEGYDYYTYMRGYETHIGRVPAEKTAEKYVEVPADTVAEDIPGKDVYGEEFDPVDHPEHYAKGTLECIDWIRYELTREEYRGYLKGCMMKYLWRHEDKGKPVQDLEKLRKYAEFLIDDYEREEADENLGFEEPGRFVPENPRAALTGVTDLREAAANMMECAAFNEATNRPLTNADLCDALGTMVTIAEKHYAKLPTEKEASDAPER